MEENPYESPRESRVSAPRGISPRFVGGLCLLGLALAFLGIGLAVVDAVTGLVAPRIRLLPYFAGMAGIAAALAFALALIAFVGCGVHDAESDR
jgi:hypothetical protein